jgi:hypothetical protein
LQLKIMNDEMIRQSRKPPLGLRPWWIVAEFREQEITSAIGRYRLAGWRAPRRWFWERRVWRLLLRFGP